MNSKIFFALLLFCALLATVIFMKRGNDEMIPLGQQVELYSLIPEGTDTATVTRLEIFAGVHPRKRTTMTRKDEQWRMLSHFNALVRPERPNRILEAAAEFRGEFRAEATEKQLADYDLNNERAFHVRGLIEGNQEPVFHLLAGKSPKPGNVFMRVAGSNTVYLVNHDIRKGAYLNTSDFDEVPTADPWLDKRVTDMPKATFTKIELTMADKALVLEKRVDSSEDNESTEALWVATEGGYGDTVNSDTVQAFTDTLSSLYAISIVDPNKNDIWGLDDPQYHLIAQRDTGETIELRVAHPSLFGPAYLQRLDNENESLYAINSTKFFTLFMKGADLFTLPGIEEDEKDILHIVYTTPEESIELKREGEEWKVVKPDSEELPIQKKIQRIVRTLASWKPADYADPSIETGLDAPQYTLTVSTESGKHTILLGNESLHVGGRYAQLDDTDNRLVMSTKDIRAIFLSTEALYTEKDSQGQSKKTINFEIPGLGNLGARAKGHDH